jgi:hypothetical protein
MCQVCCISDENCHIDVVRPQVSRFLNIRLLYTEMTPLVPECHVKWDRDGM